MKNKINKTYYEDASRIIESDLPWEKLSGQKVMVTGAGGFIGGYMVRTLVALNSSKKLQKPVQIVGMVRNVKEAQNRLSDLSACTEFKLQEWDLSQLDVPDICGCSYILHAASQASPRFYGSDPVGTLLPNTIGTIALLRALQKNSDARGFLFVSSAEVYGEAGGSLPLKESDLGLVDPASLRSCYSESKRMGEAICIAWNHQFKIPAFIVRPFHTYGPGLMSNDGRVFADFPFNVLRGENIIMMSDGLSRRAFCYISDAIAGFFTVLLLGEEGVPYNVGNPYGELSILELAEMLVNLYPDTGLVVEQKDLSKNGDAYIASVYNRLIPDIERLKNLGWRPEFSPASGFKRMIDTYK